MLKNTVFQSKNKNRNKNNYSNSSKELAIMNNILQCQKGNTFVADPNFDVLHLR